MAIALPKEPKDDLLSSSYRGDQIYKCQRYFSHINLCREVNSSALFTFLVGWHAGAVSLPLGDIISAELDCPPDNVTLYLQQE